MLTPLLADDPRQVGPYRLQNRIGAGGMGTVYLGFTPEQHPVAIKVAAEELADDAEFRRRFEREVHAALRVRGHAVAAVLDADTGAAAPWMVTEYVEGISLADAVRARGRLESHLMRGLSVGLADALVAIHAAGVVHRDLKPSNILLAWDGPKVIDFGVAHVSDSSTLTRTGHVIGTLAWMSPEQMRGEASDSSADVFAWATCVTYAATGRHPFHAETPDQLAIRVQRDSPDLNALPAYLLTAVSRALSKVPWQRPTASALLAALVGHQVEGVTEADAAADDVLERTWTGTGQAVSDSVTVLPGPDDPVRPGGSGASGPPTSGGWSPAVPGSGAPRELWPIGTPPPATAFRAAGTSATSDPPPPLDGSRLTPRPLPASPPPRTDRTQRSPEVIRADTAQPAPPLRPALDSASPSVVSRWSYDVDDADDPDPRAPVRDHPAVPRVVPSTQDAWLEDRERRPAVSDVPDAGPPGGSQRGASQAEETIREPDRAPQSRPPHPSEFPVWIRSAAGGEVVAQPETAADAEVPASDAPAPGAPGAEPPHGAALSADPRRLPVPARRTPPVPVVPPAALASPGERRPPAPQVRSSTPGLRAMPVPTPTPRRLAPPPVRAALPAPPPRPVVPPPAPLGAPQRGYVPDTEPLAMPDRSGSPGGRAGRFPPTTPPQREGLNGSALLSVLLALGWLFGLGSVAAVIVGSLAQAQIRRRNQRGRRLAAVGIGLGWTGIGLTAASLLIVLLLR